jgi:hypothetical protein
MSTIHADARRVPFLLFPTKAPPATAGAPGWRVVRGGLLLVAVGLVLAAAGLLAGALAPLLLPAGAAPLMPLARDALALGALVAQVGLCLCSAVPRGAAGRRAALGLPVCLGLIVLCQLAALFAPGERHSLVLASAVIAHVQGALFLAFLTGLGHECSSEALEGQAVTLLAIGVIVTLSNYLVLIGHHCVAGSVDLCPLSRVVLSTVSATLLGWMVGLVVAAFRAVGAQSGPGALPSAASER